MNASVSASWLLNGYFNLSKQDPRKNTSQQIREELRASLRLTAMKMASYPVGPDWRHVFWWRETDKDFAEAQFVAAISKEYPVLSLGISVEKGRDVPTAKRPALDNTWDWHHLVRYLPEVLKTDVPAVSEELGEAIHLRIRSKQLQPDTQDWTTRAFSFVNEAWFERHVGESDSEEIAAYVRSLDKETKAWVIITFTNDLGPHEADGRTPADVACILLKFAALRERLRSRR